MGALEGRICVVTGASGGIGKETAVALAALGGRVVLVCRDRARGEAALAEVKTRGRTEAAELVLADLSSQQSIREAAAEIARRHDRLHVLVNNAGGIFGTRELTVDGIERTFATNHLAYYLFTRLLLPLLEKGAPARIVSVSSAVHTNGTVDFDDLQLARGYGAMKAYSRSKLCNVLFTYELARRLEGTGVTANCLHPGVIASGFGDSGGKLFAFGVKLVRPLLTSSEKGARTSVYLASSPEVEGKSGGYYARARLSRSSKRSHDVEAQRRLWEVSAQLTGLPA